VTNYVFITGGVTSSLGKGLATAALGSLLQARGFKVRLRKLDPYLNVDPGTMSPYQHGEVYVTDDGTEADLDLGHYERFTNVSERSSDYTTSGKIYSSVIAKERRGDYLGGTVQVIPHITDEIKRFITNDIGDADFILCEIGGTVGDIEGLPLLEAIRQLRNDLGRENTLFVHLSLIPYVAAAGELKTKPTQHSVKTLLSFGIQPDILLCRSDRPISDEEKRKLSLFCNVRNECVISALDVDTIYQVPISYHEQGFDHQVCLHFGKTEGKFDQILKTLHLKSGATKPDLSQWKDIVTAIRNPKDSVKIAIVGKYVQLLDAYKSLTQALVHGGIENRIQPDFIWIDAETPADDLLAALSNADAILVPGGFGERGVSGKLLAIQYAREHKIPYLGICFGMQLAVIESCRNLLGLPEASSTEFGKTEEPVVSLLTEWVDGETYQQRSEESDLGGTMRLGTYPCQLQPHSLAQKIYNGADLINERHRHRYEVNPTYKDRLEATGLQFSGFSPDGKLPEIVERSDHPWFVGVQFHPELKSKPFAPHPLFTSFVNAALNHQKAQND
jgi:CTP synthase